MHLRNKHYPYCKLFSFFFVFLKNYIYIYIYIYILYIVLLKYTFQADGYV